MTWLYVFHPGILGSMRIDQPADFPPTCHFTALLNVTEEPVWWVEHLIAASSCGFSRVMWPKSRIALTWPACAMQWPFWPRIVLSVYWAWFLQHVSTLPGMCVLNTSVLNTRPHQPREWWGHQSRCLASWAHAKVEEFVCVFVFPCMFVRVLWTPLKISAFAFALLLNLNILPVSWLNYYCQTQSFLSKRQ